MTTTTRPDAGQASREFMLAARRLPTLFDLDDAALRLMTLAENVTDPELVAEFDAELALIDQMLMEKTESYVSVIRSLEAMSDARKVEADRLRDRARTAERHAEWLRERLLTHMKSTGRERIEMARFSVSVRTNPPAVQIVDASLVPGEYTRTKITVDIDKRAVLEAFKRDGEIVPGTEVTRSERLEVR
jgi:hypothetical protein